jgi:hypothetical protein
MLLLALLLLVEREASTQQSGVTFNKEVVRILQQHCQNCHRPGSIAPFSLLTYPEAQMRAFQIRAAVESRRMPPWKPVNAHGVFEGERSLTDREIEILSRWAAEGAPEGNTNDLPEPRVFPDTWSAGAPDLVAQPPAAYPIDGGSADIYRCFPMDVNTPTDLYIRGYEILPGNRGVVHHVILFVDGLSAALDDADPGLGYNCFGGPGFFEGVGAIGGWVPGSDASMFPVGTGVHLRAGARVVMQVHYSTQSAHGSHTHAATSLQPDLTRLGLHLSPTPLEQLSVVPVVNPFFTIPAGDPRFEVRALWPVLTNAELISISPHMHLLGREVTVSARFPNGSVRELIRIDDWDFHWQGAYRFREPVPLPAGTRIEAVVFYDNSSGNPRNPSNPPIAVRWGERTVDEMCLTVLTLKAPGAPSTSTLPFSINSGGAESVITQSASSATVQAGYARLNENTGVAPSGLAFFGYRRDWILVSEASTPAAPPIMQGRVYGEINASVRSGFAIANPNSEAAAVSFTFTDESGRDVATSSTTIPANAQIAAFLNEHPFNGPSTFSGSFTFTSTRPVAATALRGLVNERQDFLLTALPVVDLGSPPAAGSALLPHFADGAGWTTTVMLVNPSDRVMSGVLQFMDTEGKLVSQASYSIPSRSAKQHSTAGASEAVRSGSVLVVPETDESPPASSLVFSYRRAGVRLTEAGVAAVAPSVASRVYVEASDTINSGIAIANPSGSIASVKLELINFSGASIASTTLTLAPRAQISKFLTELPEFQAVRAPFQGLLRVASTTPVAVVGFRGRNNERGDFLIATTPPTPESSSAVAQLLFPHFADGGGYTTQFVIFSALPSTTTSSLRGTLRFYSQSGQPLPLKLR